MGALGELVVVMELAEGGTLADYLKQRREVAREPRYM